MTRAQKIAIGLGVAAAAFAVFLGPTVVELVRGPGGSVPRSSSTMTGNDRGRALWSTGIEMTGSRPLTRHPDVRCFYPPEREDFPAR